MRRGRRRQVNGAHRLRPRTIPYAADRLHERRVDEMARLPQALVDWVAHTGAHLLPPTLEEPTWRVRLGAKLLASQATAHNAILAAERTHRLGLPCQRVLAPLPTTGHLL